MQIIKTYEDVTRKYQHGSYGAYIDYDSHEFDGYVSGVSDEHKNTTVIFKVNAYQKYRITLNADTRFRVGTLPSYFWENGQPVNGTVVDNLYIHPKDHNDSTKINEKIEHEICIPHDAVYLAVFIWSSDEGDYENWNKCYSSLKLERVYETRDYSDDDFSIAPEVYIKTNDLSKTLAVVDNYKSLIWVKRYYTAGDFELYMLADEKLLPYLQIDNIITRENDESVMIIEKIEISTNAEDGDYFIISGRSAESILSRRVVLEPLNITNYVNPQSVIYNLIGYNTAPNTRRYISNLILSDKTLSQAKIVNGQYRGDNLLDTITSICKTFNLGIKITEYEKNLMFECYIGKETDVIFAEELDNLISSSYIIDSSEYANMAWVYGEDEGESRKYTGTMIDDSDAWGTDVKEIFVDARDLSSKIRDDNGNETQMSESAYMAKLSQRGKEKLAEKAQKVTFTAEVNYNIAFKYKCDYDLGDLVTVKNGYGTTAHARITEIMETWDENGYSCVPTMEDWEVIQ